MMKGLFPKILPHLIAVVVFLVVALIYCSPALDDKVLQQEDITQWKAAMKELEDHKAVHGEYPLWTKALFSGMPTFAIAYPSNNVIPWHVHNIISLYLSKPVGFFFVACICFYFLSLVLRVNPYIGIFGALSFAYATYNPIIISVGHDTKMWSIAYMPALLGSILLLYDHRRYWIGAGLTALFSSVLVAMNHPQIAYYFFIAVSIMTVYFVVRWILKKEYRHLAKAVGFTVVAGVVGLLVNAVSIMATYEYSKETIRGGSALASVKEGDHKEGLGKEYSFSYSMAIPEPLVMVVPRMFGGSTGYPTVLGGEGYRELKEEDSKTLEALQSVGQRMQSLPQELAPLAQATFSSATPYWGGIGGTSGPPYVGAVVCFLAILALFVLDNRHKWWMLTAIALTIIMSWGSYLESVNILFYKYLPLYNKFRAPSMILVIPQLLLPALAVMGLHRIAYHEGSTSLWPSVKKGLVAAGVLVLILFAMYLSFDYLGDRDEQLLRQANNIGEPQLIELVRTFQSGLKADRQALFLGDLFRTVSYMGFTFLFVWLLYRRKISKYIGFGAIALMTLIDLVQIDNMYLNRDNYFDAPEEGAGMIPTTDADRALLADTSYFRVVSDPSSGDPFSGNNYVAYHYNSVGGYHTARLSIFNDLIDSQLRRGNMAVYNMLNTKYIVQKDRNGGTVGVQPNAGALGPVWFVKGLQVVPDAAAEMKALDRFNPRDTAVIQQRFLQKLGTTATSYPAEGSIQFIRNDNNSISYQSSSTANEFAVFSEIYYEAGWKAFIDGKEVPIAKVNYVLRGVPVPAGNHAIEFRFEPEGFYTGKKITTVFSIVLVLLLLAGIFFEWRNRKTADVK